MNNPRLIDANALLDKLPYPIDYAESEFYRKILDVIEAMPTAYDIDNVVKELIDHTQECTDRITYETHSFVLLFDAIKIVKDQFRDNTKMVDRKGGME